jgi:hypothetical protein
VPKVYYTVKMDGRWPYALVLESEEAKKAEKYEGYYNARELHENMKDIFGANVTRLKGSDFQAELEKRLVHTSDVLALLKRDGELLGQDLTRHFVYGSYNRPMNSLWASISNAVYIQADKYQTGYHTYVAVPATLDDETISRYELAFVSRPAPDEVTKLRELLRDYYEAACVGAKLEDATDAALRDYEDRMSALQRRAEVLLKLAEEKAS